MILMSAGTIWNVLGLPAANQVLLLSKQTGRYVHVSEDGEIDARSSKNSATVFVMVPKDSTVQFELYSKPGMFLMLERINTTPASDATYRNGVDGGSGQANATESPSDGVEYALVVGNATETSLTRWDRATGPVSTLSQSVRDKDTSCYVAFDSRGEVTGPCDLNAVDNQECEVTIERWNPPRTF